MNYTEFSHLPTLYRTESGDEVKHEDAQCRVSVFPPTCMVKVETMTENGWQVKDVVFQC